MTTLHVCMSGTSGSPSAVALTRAFLSLYHKAVTYGHIGVTLERREGGGIR